VPLRKLLVHFFWVLIALLSAAMPATAQSKANPQPKKDNKTITDVAGRVHTRYSRITHAQRKSVAVRMKAARKAAAKKGQNTRTEVKK
jgi:hypothetical protein